MTYVARGQASLMNCKEQIDELIITYKAKYHKLPEQLFLYEELIPSECRHDMEIEYDGVKIPIIEYGGVVC